jgi:preprotein translocase subunit SecF
MAHSEQGQRVSEKKILALGAIVILIIIALISYFEWQGRHVY